MKYGISSGALWGLDTVVLGVALVLLVPWGGFRGALVAATLHDLFCALLLLVYMGVRGRLRKTLEALKTRAGKAVVGAAVLGGPLGMLGYLLAIENIGVGPAAIISSFYPAFGTLLAFVLLGERMRGRQVISLFAALIGIAAIGWTSVSELTTGHMLLGVLGALAAVVGWGSEAVILAWGMKDEAVDNEVALQIRETTSALVYLLIVAPLTGTLVPVASVMFSKIPVPVLCAAVAGTLSYLFYYKAISRIGAVRAMALNVSYSAWALIFGFLLMREVPSLLEVVAGLVVLAGTVLAASSDWSQLLPGKRVSPRE